MAIQVENPVRIHEQGQEKPIVKFTLCDFILISLSLIVYVADVVTDTVLGIQYLVLGHHAWGVGTIALSVFPLILTQLISLRWHVVDQTQLSHLSIFLHCSFLGVIQRYLHLLKGIHAAQKNTDNINNKQLLLWLHHYQSDLCLLRLFESFLESAPQLLLQLYVMHELGSWHPWAVVCVIGSLISLAWGIASYAKVMRDARDDKARINWVGFVLQAVWRTGTMISRIVALLCCASVIQTWFLLAISIHWLMMTFWTVKQKTDLCTTAWEERIYNAIVGVVYCFDFFNLKEGQSRQRVVVFYTITAIENAGCLAVFLQFSDGHIYDKELHIAAPIIIIVGSIVGHTSQLVYYRWFHPSGPIKIGSSHQPATQQTASVEAGLQLETSPGDNPALTVRTLKSMNRKFSGVSLASTINEPTVATICTFEVTGYHNTALAPEQPSRKAPSPPSIVRNRAAKSISDSRLIDTVPKVGGVVSMLKTKSEGQLLMKYAVEKRLWDLLTKDDNQSDASSVCPSFHDYENMITLNVNRTNWGIRHWKSYSDIETSFHDNSICKEREVLECSTTSASSVESNRILTGKISINEAISQLKYLAVNGRNMYQSNPEPVHVPELYECIWLHAESGENEGKVTVVQPPIKPCPTKGLNLSIITEVSEGGSSTTSSSNKSKSSLVRTVDAIMDSSLCDSLVNSTNHREQLTYVEVSFLSKLCGSEEESYTGNQKPARRQFSIIRERFECNDLKEKQRFYKSDGDKENIPIPVGSLKITDYHRTSLSRKQATLSPNSRIFLP